ncbi:putative methyltransferase At1g22800, mitochondrial [Cucurbita pepo subsp. pepo]|uniref:putative methyltransferase At1g22800, mitochondrial n=1 Tax=Cucurbita pepo subsp. pepo TaxID=3664 RepID=UPI000C9DA04D|nr:putative methyltransferase At1g22800, mitochondrial [Cucurbita pepo subsp. pepo]
MRGLSPSGIRRSLSALRSTRRRDFQHSILCCSFCTGDDNYDGRIGDGTQTSKVKVFDRDLKRKQVCRGVFGDIWRKYGEIVKIICNVHLFKGKFWEYDCFSRWGLTIHCFICSVEKLIMMDASHDMIMSCKDDTGAHDQDVETSFIIGDEEFLPIQESSVDLIVSCLGLHWTNDLPGAMIQSRLALKPDGLFLAAIFGGETLRELRIACTLAHMEREGGISPRVSPLAQVRDAGNLLTRAGFTLPGVDVDEYVVRYPSALELVEHLRAMGETNALLQRNPILKRETALATAAIYDSMFAAEDGTIPATFQVIYMTGWKEHSSQQKAKRRGSATISFSDIKKQFGNDH